MPFIQNIAAMDVPERFHKNPGDKCILIQIMDTGTKQWPIPKHKFKQIYRFEFLDVEEDTVYLHTPDKYKISDKQAADLVEILTNALRTNTNIIVHCHAGVCRSGAVTEVGVMMGFEDTGKYRNPNLLVKKKMMKVLGLTYEDDVPEGSLI